MCHMAQDTTASPTVAAGAPPAADPNLVTSLGGGGALEVDTEAAMKAFRAAEGASDDDDDEAQAKASGKGAKGSKGKGKGKAAPAADEGEEEAEEGDEEGEEEETEDEGEESEEEGDEEEGEGDEDEEGEEEEEEEEEPLTKEEAAKREAELKKLYKSAHKRDKKSRAMREAVVSERRQLDQEKSVAAQFLQENITKLQNFDRLRQMVEDGDDELFDVLGIDQHRLEKLATNFLDRESPHRKAERAQKKLEREQAAWRQQQEQAARQQSEAARLSQTQQFQQFALAPENREACPFAARLAKQNPAELARLAWQAADHREHLMAEAQKAGNHARWAQLNAIRGAALLREVDAYLKGLAGPSETEYSDVSARRTKKPLRKPDAAPPAKTKVKAPAKGLKRLDPRKTTAKTVDPKTLDEDGRYQLALKVMAATARKGKK